MSGNNKGGYLESTDGDAENDEEEAVMVEPDLQLLVAALQMTTLWTVMKVKYEGRLV